MTQVLLYWNHICVLHRQEKAFLEKLAQALHAEDIELTVRYFGLGYPEHMSEYLAKPDAILPDILVSADLEVFEDARLFGRLSPTLYPARSFVPLRDSAALTICERGEQLLPFLAIPLVYFTREESAALDKSLCEMDGLCVGGVNNSAVKTVVKTLLSRDGEDATARFLAQANVSDMPIGAYQQVRMGAGRTALVPSLYALRADGGQTHLVTPRGGPLLIPSYFAARTSIPESIARRIANAILCQELCDFYAANGDLLVFPACTTLTSHQEGDRYLAPAQDWLAHYDPAAFEDFYQKHVSGARKLFSES